MATYASPRIAIFEYDFSQIVPAVGATTGGIAGLFAWGPILQTTLIGSEAQLASRFGKPSNLNSETWFTTSSFLAYGSPCWVVRTANTTDNTGANGVLSAIANNGMVSNVLFQMVVNDSAYATKSGLFDTNMRYVARYPGRLGNSLRVSVCYTANAFSSVINLASFGTGGTFSINVAQNTATVVINATSNTAAGANANSFINMLSITDQIPVGNNSTGQQDMKITSIVFSSNTNVTGNSTQGQATVTLNFEDEFSTHSNWSTANTLQRLWEFYQYVGTAPGQSQYVANFGNSAANDEMHIILVDDGGIITGVPGTVLETYKDVSRATDAKGLDNGSIYYSTVVNQQSSWMWWCDDELTGNAVSNTANNIASCSRDQIMDLTFDSGSDGDDEDVVPLNIIAYGYDVFANKETVPVSLIMQGKNVGPVYPGQLGNYIINIAETRQDCVAFCSPDLTDVVNNKGLEMEAIINFRNNMVDSSYGVLDSGYKYMYDIYNNLYRWVPLNGDVAGCCALTDYTRDPWWSPAGFNRGNIKNIVQLAYNPPQDERDQLYPSDINPVVSFPGMGTVLYGDKTMLSIVSAFSRINVRRLFIALEIAIAQMAQSFLFEFNDSFTRANFVNIVTPYLKQIKALRGITDFVVVCDETNNTPQVIDNNQFIGDIFVKPNRSINFIDLNFVAVGTAISFSEVEGQVP